MIQRWRGRVPCANIDRRCCITRQPTASKIRQKTPRNIVEITRLLLEAGAEVNAESDAYGGRSTTLELTATSCHPENAGVQLPLMQLLFDYGARVDRSDGGSIVNSCLHNGRGAAAEFLASHGARLDLEGAAGVGRLDLVKSFLSERDGLRSLATQQEKDAFSWACQFGRTPIVDLFLRQGFDVDTKLRHHGQTGLHWAAYGGHSETVKLLLELGSPIDAKDDVFGGTPLEWALYQWQNAAPAEIEGRRYYETVGLLVRAGAKLEPDWHSRDSVRRSPESDPLMQQALRGETASSWELAD